MQTRSEVDLEELVHVGPETLGGRYWRRFWHPVYRSADLPPGRAIPLTILGEQFTLCRGDAPSPSPSSARGEGTVGSPSSARGEGTPGSLPPAGGSSTTTGRPLVFVAPACGGKGDSRGLPLLHR